MCEGLIVIYITYALLLVIIAPVLFQNKNYNKSFPNKLGKETWSPSNVFNTVMCLIINLLRLISESHGTIDSSFREWIIYNKLLPKIPNFNKNGSPDPIYFLLICVSNSFDNDIFFFVRFNKAFYFDNIHVDLMHFILVHCILNLDERLKITIQCYNSDLNILIPFPCIKIANAM